MVFMPFGDFFQLFSIWDFYHLRFIIIISSQNNEFEQVNIVEQFFRNRQKTELSRNPQHFYVSLIFFAVFFPRTNSYNSVLLKIAPKTGNFEKSAKKFVESAIKFVESGKACEIHKQLIKHLFSNLSCLGIRNCK